MGSKSVQPCKVSPDLQPHARVPYAGVELEHSVSTHGRGARGWELRKGRRDGMISFL